MELAAFFPYESVIVMGIIGVAIYLIMFFWFNVDGAAHLDTRLLNSVLIALTVGLANVCATFAAIAFGIDSGLQ